MAKAKTPSFVVTIEMQTNDFIMSDSIASIAVCKRKDYAQIKVADPFLDLKTLERKLLEFNQGV